MAKIEFNSYELVVGKTKEGDEVIQFRNGFESDFIADMKAQGVKEREITIEQDEE